MSSSPTKGSKKKGETKTSVVDHTYRDYSHVEIMDLVDDYKGVNEELFPSKLHMILSTPEYARFIKWKPHGRTWAVMDRSMFTSIVLPKYFNHSNFASFNRSVNGWGFKRLFREGPDQKAYYHELFLCGRPELTSAMTRLISPGKRLPNKACEPDFYDISRKYPLPDPPAALPSEDEETDIHNQIAPSPIFTPIFTPPPATKQFRLSNSQGTHPYHGYHHGYNPHASMSHTRLQPYSKPPPYSQPPTYAQHPPYSQTPPNYFPPPHGTSRSPPGHFYHRHPRAVMPPRGPLNTPFRHPNPWGPAIMHPREWHTSSPHHPYSRPPAHAIIQHHEEQSPEVILPILHSNQIGYNVHLNHTIAKIEVNEVNETDEKKPAAQDILRPGQDQVPRIDSPLLDGSPSQSLEGLEFRSATMKTWKYNEEDRFNENAPDPAPEKLSMHGAHEVPGADENGHNAKEEHNAFDIDNFYDSPTKAHNKKEWVVYPTQKRREEGGEGGSPEPEY